MDIYDTAAYGLETQTVDLCNRMTMMGMRCDRDQALALQSELEAAHAYLAEQLQTMFPPREVIDWFTPKRSNSKKGYLKDIPFPKKMMQNFNPNSSQQIVARLGEKYGWT